jgi:type VI protein secretion system component VasK
MRHLWWIPLQLIAALAIILSFAAFPITVVLHALGSNQWKWLLVAGYVCQIFYLLILLNRYYSEKARTKSVPVAMMQACFENEEGEQLRRRLQLAESVDDFNDAFTDTAEYFFSQGRRHALENQ